MIPENKKCRAAVRAGRLCTAVLLLTACMAGTAGATTLTIRGYDDNRTLGDFRSIYGNQGTAEAELFNAANYANWGISGVNRLSAVTTVTAADLVGVDIFFTGLIYPTPPSAAEVSALVDFVNSGGVIMGLGDRSTDLNQIDPLMNAFGLDLLPAPPSGNLTILEAGHPIIDGPFGTVTTITSGDSSAFTTLGGFDGTVIADNSNGTGAVAVVGPNGSTRDGAFLFFPNSEPYFGGMSGDHLTLFRNSIAYAAGIAAANAVPAPATLLLLIGSLAVVAGARDRRRR